MYQRSWITLLFYGLLATACTVPQAGQRPEGPNPQQPSSAPRRLVAAIMAERPALYRAFITGTGATTQAVDIADTLVNIGLSISG